MTLLIVVVVPTKLNRPTRFILRTLSFSEETSGKQNQTRVLACKTKRRGLLHLALLVALGSLWNDNTQWLLINIAM